MTFKLGYRSYVCIECEHGWDVRTAEPKKKVSCPCPECEQINVPIQYIEVPDEESNTH